MDEKTITQSRLENLNIVCPKNPKNKTQKIIINCPNSSPSANSRMDKN